MRNPRKSYAFITVTLGILAGLLAGEVVLRLVLARGLLPEGHAFLRYQRHLRAGKSIENSIYRESEDPLLMIEFIPGARRDNIRINRHGFRGSEVSRAPVPGVSRIVLLGDSETFGASLAEDETLAGCLESALNHSAEEARFEVLNFGFPGRNTEAEVHVLMTRAIQFDPAIVILYYVFNDPYGSAAAFLKKLHWYDRSALIAFVGWAAQTHVVWFNREEMQHRKRSAVDGLLGLHEESRFEVTRTRIRDLADFLHEGDIRFLLLIAPEIKYYDDYGAYPFHPIHETLHGLASDRIEVVDPFAALARSGIEPKEFWVAPTDNHKNERANEIIAKVVADHILAD